MKHYLKFIALFFVILIMNSCATYRCDGYDVSNRYAISFRQNDTIQYLSNNDDTLRLPVIEFSAEGPTDVKVFFNTSIICLPSAMYKTAQVNGFSIEENQLGTLSVTFSDDAEYKLYAISNKVDGDHVSECTDNKIIDGTKYDTVWEVEDLSGKRRIDQFVKVANHGILKFHDRKTGLTWAQILR